MDINLQISEYGTKHLVYRNEPVDFDPIVEVAGCFCECDGKYLQLKRAKGTLQEGTWCMPAGKFESKELPSQAVIRETFEETGIQLEGVGYIGKFYVRGENYDYLYHAFHQKFPKYPKVLLSKEHDEYRWMTFEETFKMPLILGSREIIHHFKTRNVKTKLSRKSFYFMRHGEIDIPCDLNLSDSASLNANGKVQSLGMQNAVSSLSIESVCFSPILRARETKDILVKDLDVTHHEIHNLSECSTDTWKKMVQIEEKQGYPISIEVENFMLSVLEGMNTALEVDSLPLIVAHGGVHWAMCYHLMLEDHPWKVDYCKLLHFEPVGTAGWKVNQILA